MESLLCEHRTHKSKAVRTEFFKNAPGGQVAEPLQVAIDHPVGVDGEIRTDDQSVLFQHKAMIGRVDSPWRRHGRCPGRGSDPCLLYTSPSPRDRTRSRMPSS